MNALFDQNEITTVVHFAAESHVDRSILDPLAFVRSNVLGTATLLDACRKKWGPDPDTSFRFHHVSTDEVYGSLGATGAFTESTPYAPNSPYAASKASSDHLVRAFHHTYGFPTLTTNCSNNYGPFQFPEKLIPLIIQNALDFKPLPIYGDGLQVRDWLFVHDHVDAINTVLENGTPGEVYNVGGNSEKTNLEVLDTLCGLLDRLLPDSPHRPHARLKTFVADRPGHDQRYAIDSSKLQRELGWEPLETFDSGLERTVRWYLDNSVWCERVSDGSYLGERLGAGSETE